MLPASVYGAGQYRPTEKAAAMPPAKAQSGLRDLFVRLVILVPLLQAFAPTIAALNPSEDVWCRSVASQTSRSTQGGPSTQDGQCMVCIAFAIGGSSAPACASTLATPVPVVAELLTPQPEAGMRHLGAQGGKQIRAPPAENPHIRIPVADGAGTALA